MLSTAIQQHILELLRQKLGGNISSLQFSTVGGGSINHTYRINTNTKHQVFCKLNSASKFPGLFEAERQGLQLLKAPKIFHIPEVITTAVVDDIQILLMEWIEQGPRTKQFWRDFGGQLAALHTVQDDSFGLAADNYMGALPQSNRQHANWNDFFIQERLEPQLKLAADNRLLSAQEISRFERLYVKLQQIFPPVAASILHGDLWSGNFLCDQQGRPVLIDPAVYYGHPAIDLAMTTLFGGFDQAFYDAYNSKQALPANYEEQWEVANLYPLLIHLNLFGESYKTGILNTIHRY